MINMHIYFSLQVTWGQKSREMAPYYYSISSYVMKLQMYLI